MIAYLKVDWWNFFSFRSYSFYLKVDIATRVKCPKKSWFSTLFCELILQFVLSRYGRWNWLHLWIYIKMTAAFTTLKEIYLIISAKVMKRPSKRLSSNQFIFFTSPLLTSQTYACLKVLEILKQLRQYFQSNNICTGLKSDCTNCTTVYPQRLAANGYPREGFITS